MKDTTPRFPFNRYLKWPDEIFELQDVIASLTDSPVYLVGGVVRDAYLIRPIKDIDLVVPEGAIQLAKQLADALDGDIFIMDDERDVARVFSHIMGTPFVIDISGFRGDDLYQDLTLRDFTMNAIAVDIYSDLKKIIDPTDGEVDLERRVLQRCSPSAISDDPLRALRAVRQSLQFSFRIEPETLKDIRTFSPALRDVSPERVRDEFHSLLNLEKVASGLRIAAKVGILENVVQGCEVLQTIPAPDNPDQSLWDITTSTVDKLHQVLLAISPKRTDDTAAAFDLGMMVMQFDHFRASLNAHLGQTYANNRTHRALLMLAALLHQIAPDTRAVTKQVETYADALRLSSAEKKRLVMITRHYERLLLIDADSILETHRFWFRLQDTGIDVILMGLAVFLARTGADLQQNDWLLMVDRSRKLLWAWFEQQDEVVNPALFVNGNDLLEELDLKGGRIIGQLLTLIREAQVTGRIQTRDEALALARESVNSQG